MMTTNERELLLALSHLIGGAESVMLDSWNTDWDRGKFEAGLAHARKAKADYLARLVANAEAAR